jgi:glutamate formiminotransferase/formiminotetrahydrofolate cyclodeaminase
MKQIIECVPNFSEGRNPDVIKQITDQIRSVEGVKLLNVDPGKATNRTVVTFVGEPEQVVEAAFLAVKKTSQVIDMSKHKGEHPRFGATDVCPLVPVRGISMEDVVIYARKLAERIGDELKIPVYCYEKAAFKSERRNLADVRSGEYEGLKEKLADPAWKPDYGPAVFNPRTGAVAVGARNFLVAYNINLNTTSTRRANAIAFDIREKGRVKREDNNLTGRIIKDDEGKPVYEPGSLKSVKAIGWYIKEYGIAQISINLTDITITPIHMAFEEACKRADERGIRVTGSELVGMVPMNAMLEAGRYFLKKQQRSTGVSDGELVKIAIKSLGLNDLYEFKPQEKIIEYMLDDHNDEKLIRLSVEDFMLETASESPAPGGGSVSAYIGALGAALGTMVANLSSHKRGWDDRWEEFSDWADKGKQCQEELLQLVDEDSRAFNALMTAYGLPKSSEKEKNQRDQAIKEATRQAILVPFRVMQMAQEALGVIRAMAEIGNPNSVSDAGVGALAIRTAIMGAHLNVKINMAGLDDKEFVEKIIMETTRIEGDTIAVADRILDEVNNKIKEL